MTYNLHHYILKLQDSIKRRKLSKAFAKESQKSKNGVLQELGRGLVI